MKLLLTGGTGLIGKTLVDKLLQDHHEICLLTRNPNRWETLFSSKVKCLYWDALKGMPPKEAYKDVEGIVNLMGEGIAEKSWTEAQKKKIRDTRVLGTKHLVDGAVSYATSLKHYVSASAIGYYDHTYSTSTLTEMSPHGSNFMALLCKEWEEASLAICAIPNIREVRIRIGVVLSHSGGALAKMIPPFKWGVGGRLGTGDQWMNWVHIDDVIALFEKALTESNYSGAFNAVSPGNVTNREFTKQLARVLRRPAFFHVPGFVLTRLLGDMAPLVLQGGQVIPQRTLNDGFEFKYIDLSTVLKTIL